MRPALGMTNSAASTISVAVSGCFIHFSTRFMFQLGALFYTFLNTAAVVSGLLCSCYITFCYRESWKEKLVDQWHRY